MTSQKQGRRRPLRNGLRQLLQRLRPCRLPSSLRGGGEIDLDTPRSFHSAYASFAPACSADRANPDDPRGPGRAGKVLSRLVLSLLGFERFAYFYASPDSEGARRSHAPTRPPSLSSVSPIRLARPGPARETHRSPRIPLERPKTPRTGTRTDNAQTSKRLRHHSRLVWRRACVSFCSGCTLVAETGRDNSWWLRCERCPRIWIPLAT